MTDETSQMRREITQIPDAVENLLSQGQDSIARAAAALRARDPHLLVTIARGSSDHACTYLKYATEILLGLPVSSVGPSIASIYHAPLRLKGAASLAVSQSGQSPDIVEMARAARAGGALSLALTNHPASPLGLASEYALDIHAGPELSVAATKTFVTSAVAGLMLLADWSDDAALRDALRRLPRALADAAALDWPDFSATVGQDTSVFTLGRGPAWAIANEAALKFKETCQIHAESYSSAEVLHGPVSIVGHGFPVLALAAADAAEPGLAEIADTLAGKGAQVFVTSEKARAATRLPHIRTAHALTDPLSLVVSFYAMVEKTAARLGINPDAPRHLKKVTETV